MEYIDNTGPDKRAIISYPKQLFSDKKYGIIVWGLGPGVGPIPGTCEGINRGLESHGLVVIALGISPVDGNKAIEALDWLDIIN